MDQVYDRYSTSFVWGGSRAAQIWWIRCARNSPRTTRRGRLLRPPGRLRPSGLAIIFGGTPVAEAPRAAFWLISYADRTMKDFTEVGKSVKLLLRDAA